MVYVAHSVGSQIGNLTFIGCNSWVFTLNQISPYTFIDFIISLPLIQAGHLPVTDKSKNTHMLVNC